MNLLEKTHLGSAQFGLNYGITNVKGKTSAKEVAAILELAASSGIKSIDTAVNYGDAELVLGEVGVSDFKIYTKIPCLSDQVVSPKELEFRIESFVEGSLKRLNVDRLQGVYLHNECDLSSKLSDYIYSYLLKLRNNGVISQFGISTYSVKNSVQICGDYSIDIIQMPANILDRTINQNAIQALTARNNVKLVARSIFLQGLLLLALSKIPKYFQKWQPLLQEWDTWVATNGTSKLSACLSFIESLNNLEGFVIGVESRQHLAQIVSSVKNGPNLFPTKLLCEDRALINPRYWPDKSW